jgi:hypothetical protein
MVGEATIVHIIEDDATEAAGVGPHWRLGGRTFGLEMTRDDPENTELNEVSTSVT